MAVDVDDGLVRLACRAMPGLGGIVTVEVQPRVQPDNGEILSLL
jgi:hypothetical protein